MVRVALLVLILSAIRTTCLRQLTKQPLRPSDSNSSLNLHSLQAVVIREVAPTPNLSVQKFVANAAGTSHEVNSLNDNGMTQVLKAIFWILKKAARAVSIYSKANNVKLALKETRDAVDEAVGTIETMGSKLLRASGFFAKAGLPAFIESIEKGELDALVKADFSDAVEEVESLADELDDLLGISRSVVMVMKTVRSIGDDAKDFSDGLLDLDLESLLIPLEKHVRQAVLSFEEFLSIIKRQCVKAKESLERFVTEDLAAGKEYAKTKAQSLFGDLTPYIEDFNEIYETIVKPLILELVKAIKGAYKAAKQLNVPLDAPESVADESIDRQRCSWRQTRWFKSIEDYNVDIEKTMECDTEKTFGRWFKCRCIGTEDCYVPQKYRPEAQDFRRCFRKV